MILRGYFGFLLFRFKMGFHYVSLTSLELTIVDLLTSSS